jgi:hypothetical protein
VSAAGPLGVLPQNLHPERVKRRHREALQLPLGEFPDASLHFAGSLAGERKRQNLALRNAPLKHVRNAEGG